MFCLPSGFRKILPQLLVWLFEIRESVGIGLKKFRLWVKKIEILASFSFIDPRLLGCQMEHLGSKWA